jgi:phage tail-like protein
MPQFDTAPAHEDTYQHFRFKVKWDGHAVAGVSRMSPLKRMTEVVEHRSGGDPNTRRKLPGSTKYEAITLERGLSHDTAFEEWAAKSIDASAATSAKSGLRKDIVIELYDESGKLQFAYRVFRCWVSAYQALPALDAEANAIAFESITIENEGWERVPV